MSGRTCRALYLVALTFGLAGCPRTVERPDGGSDAGIDASYDPVTGNAFVGPILLDDERVRAIDPSGLRAGVAPCRAPILGRVYNAIDGDTISVSGQSEVVDLRVRLIGVDTPEIARMDSPAECYAAEAKVFTEQLVDRLVWLTFDEACLDRFDRALAYVHVGAGEGDLWERQLLRRGFARELTVSPNDTYESVFLDDERHAEAANVGIWSACF